MRSGALSKQLDFTSAGHRRHGRAEVWVFMLGGWRQAFAANRAEAEKFAGERIRHGGAVVCIELRERDSVSASSHGTIGDQTTFLRNQTRRAISLATA